MSFSVTLGLYLTLAVGAFTICIGWRVATLFMDIVESFMFDEDFEEGFR